MQGPDRRETNGARGRPFGGYQLTGDCENRTVRGGLLIVGEEGGGERKKPRRSV